MEKAWRDNTFVKPQLKMIASTAIFGTLSLFIRHIPLTSAEVALFRAAVGLGCILAAKGLAKKGLPLKSMGREGLLLFLSGAAMGFNWIFLFEAYKYTTVSVATLSYYFASLKSALRRTMPSRAAGCATATRWIRSSPISRWQSKEINVENFTQPGTFCVRPPSK